MSSSWMQWTSSLGSQLMLWTRPLECLRLMLDGCMCVELQWLDVDVVGLHRLLDRCEMNIFNDRSYPFQTASPASHSQHNLTRPKRPVFFSPADQRQMLHKPRHIAKVDFIMRSRMQLLRALARDPQNVARPVLGCAKHDLQLCGNLGWR